VRFIDEDELLGIALGDLRPPRRPLGGILFAGNQGLFLRVSPSRCKVRHMVARLTAPPWCSVQRSQ
jgi:hypothetical protein